MLATIVLTNWLRSCRRLKDAGALTLEAGEGRVASPRRSGARLSEDDEHHSDRNAYEEVGNRLINLPPRQSGSRRGLAASLRLDVASLASRSCRPARTAPRHSSADSLRLTPMTTRQGSSSHARSAKITSAEEEEPSRSVTPTTSRFGSSCRATSDAMSRTSVNVKAMMVDVTALRRPTLAKEN